MNHTQNSRHRKLKNRIRSVFDRMSFRFFHFHLHQKIGVLGVLLSLSGLFLSWFSVFSESFRAFSGSVGYVGYVTVLIAIIVSFSLFSLQTKSDVKSRSGIGISDHAIIIFSGILIFVLSFVMIHVIRGFALFSKDVLLGDGPKIVMIGGIFLIFSGYLGYRSYKRELLDTFVENSRTTSEMLEEYSSILNKEGPDKKNMSLPI